MELWQLDILGKVFLSNGIGVSLVTGIDDHSRFCVIAKVVAGRRLDRCARRCSRPSTPTGFRRRS
jgi:hypothetical protein